MSNRESIPKLLYALASGEEAKERKTDIIFVEAAKLIENSNLKIYDAGEDKMRDATQHDIDQLNYYQMFGERRNKAIKKIAELGMLTGLPKLQQIEEILNG